MRRSIRRLKEGGRIRIVAPSSPFAPEHLEEGIARLERAGYRVVAEDVLRGQHAYLNGDDATRASVLQAALADRDADVVWLARGGYGLTRILDQLEIPDGELPTVIGFSDATALLALLHQRGIPCVHGPLATTLRHEPQASLDHTLALLGGANAEETLPGAVVLHGGPVVTGPVFVANLCVLSHLVGTPACPDLSGHILVIEEIGERPYRIDRMLTQLLQAGALDGVVGVGVGHLSGCEESGAQVRRVPAPSALDVIAERTAALQIPVIGGLPIGHQAPNYALRIGSAVTLCSGDAPALVLPGA